MNTDCYLRENKETEFFCVTKLSVEQCWNYTDGEEPKYLGKSLSQSYSVHHISHRDWSAVKPRTMATA